MTRGVQDAWQNRRVPANDPTPPVPRWTPSARELDDLDLILGGRLAPPVTGFVDPYAEHVVAPLTLVVDAETAQVAGALRMLDLVDPEGVPLARMTVTGHWQPDIPDRVGLLGDVERLSSSEFGPFRRLHLSPAQVHERYDASALLAVPVTRALTDADLAGIRHEAAERSLVPLLLACVGTGLPQGLTGPALVRATRAAAEALGTPAEVVAVAVADHSQAPGADPGRANTDLLAAVCRAYADRTMTVPDDASGGPLPPAVQQVVDAAHPPRSRQGLVVFFTGLSGSGKSTLARGVVDHILEYGDRTVTSLDGDVVRHHLSKGLGFSRADRETNIMRIGFVAAEIARHGGVAVCSPIAPFAATRQRVREMVEAAGGGFVLVHVATPLEECERRDRKGLYAKARAGEIPDFTGISSPYEEPDTAESIKVDTTNRLIAECVREVVSSLVREGWLPH